MLGHAVMHSIAHMPAFMACTVTSLASVLQYDQKDIVYIVASARAWNSQIFGRILIYRWKSGYET